MGVSIRNLRWGVGVKGCRGGRERGGGGLFGLENRGLFTRLGINVGFQILLTAFNRSLVEKVSVLMLLVDSGIGRRCWIVKTLALGRFLGGYALDVGLGYLG